MDARAKRLEIFEGTRNLLDKSDMLCISVENSRAAQKIKFYARYFFSVIP